MSDDELQKHKLDLSPLEFVADNLSSLEEVDKIIKYCQGVARSQISVDRLPTTDVTELSKTAKLFMSKDINPLQRPTFVSQPFGSFDVD